MPDLSIIIVNWKSAAHLGNCLRTICENIEELKCEIVIVDNASYDGSADVARQYGEFVRFVQSNENLGFSRGNNLGFRHSVGDTLLFLNPDTEVRGDALVRMHDSLKSLSDAGSLGCRILNSDGTVQTSCIQAFPTITNQLLDAELLRKFTKKSSLWGIAPLFDNSRNPVEVEAISGACLMIRREVFEAVGMFSKDYFMYAEDLDLCFKTRQAGFRNYYFGDADVVHHGGVSTKKRGGNSFSAVLQRESMKRFMKKFHGINYSRLFVLTVQCGAFFRMISLIVVYPFIIFGIIDRDNLNISLQKWWNIFRWSIGAKEWTR